MHGNIQFTHDYYYGVLIGDTVFAAATLEYRSIINASKYFSATQQMSKPLQQIVFGSAVDPIMKKEAIEGAAGIVANILKDTAVVAPLTDLAVKIFDVELTIKGARNKVVSGYEQQAEQIMSNIQSLSQGIEAAREQRDALLIQMLRE